MEILQNEFLKRRQKTVKKYLLFVLIFCCFAASCSPVDPLPSAPYETTVVDAANSENLKISGSPIWSGSSFQDQDAEKSISVNFLEESYTGNYKQSQIELWTSFTADYYESEAGVSFAIERGTQRMVYLHIYEAFSNQAMLLPDVENAREGAISYAKEHAAALIDIDEYEMTVEEEVYTSGEVSCTFYYVMFAKKVNEFLSMEYISFKISSKGQLATYTAGERPGTFKEGAFAECVTETVDESIWAAMNREGNEFSYRCKSIKQTRTPKFVLTPGGEYGVFSSISVEWEHNKKNKSEMGGYSVFTHFGEKSVG